MSERISKRFSRKVTVVSFILSIFVTYIHAKNLVYYNLGDISGTPIFILNQIFSEILGRIGVPFFFLLSGYWMFRFDIRQSGYTTLFRKIKRKIYTLLVPYLIWNTVGMLFFLIMTRIPFLSSMVNGGMIVPITIDNILQGVFLHKYYLPFWFMQDLIVLTMISPIVLFLLRQKWLSHVAVVILTVMLILGINIRLCQVSSLLLFLLGGIISVYYRDFWEKKNENHLLIMIWCLLFFICCILKWIDFPNLSKVVVIIMPIFFWKAMDFLDVFAVYGRKPSWFFKQSFFIYAVHIIPVASLSRLLSKFSNTMIWASISYMITPPVILCFIYIIAKMLNSKCPGIYRILCGGRNGM